MKRVFISSSQKEFAAERAALRIKYSSGETPVKTPVETPVKMLQLLEKEPQMTLAEVAGEIGKSLRAVGRVAAKLVKNGSLSHAGPQTGGH